MCASSMAARSAARSSGTSCSSSLRATGFSGTFPQSRLPAIQPASMRCLMRRCLPARSAAEQGAAAPSTIDAAACTLQTNLGLATYAAAATNYSNGIAGLNTMLGTVPRTGRRRSSFPKIDWQINSRNHASFEVNRLRWASPAGIQTAATVSNGIAASATTMSMSPSASRSWIR